jgi:hypothetical protein
LNLEAPVRRNSAGAFNLPGESQERRKEKLKIPFSSKKYAFLVATLGKINYTTRFLQSRNQSERVFYSLKPPKRL